MSLLAGCRESEKSGCWPQGTWGGKSEHQPDRREEFENKDPKSSGLQLLDSETQKALTGNPVEVTGYTFLPLAVPPGAEERCEQKEVVLLYCFVFVLERNPSSRLYEHLG